MDYENIVPLTKRDHEATESVERKKERSRDLIRMAEEFLDKNPMVFVQRLNCYFALSAADKWVPVKRYSMADRHEEWSIPRFPQAITRVMAKRGLLYLDITISFAAVGADVFNGLRRDRWLQPQDGPYPVLFDTLMQSLGGNKPENIAHIEHLLAYKYAHPETSSQLPALAIHGEGGVGKNLLVQHVLAQVYPDQTTAQTAEMALSSHNTELEGMMVCLLDESNAEKINDAILKNLIGNSRIWINPKNINKYLVDNTALYIISSNSEEGAVYLNRSHADRRLSICYCLPGQPLEYWIARERGWIAPEVTALTEREPIYQQARQWMHETGYGIVTNKDNVAKWLGHLVRKYADAGLPTPLHGDDYQRVSDLQKPTHEAFIAAVLGAEEFKYIERGVFLEGYRITCRDHGYRPIGSKRFYHAVRSHARLHMPELVEIERVIGDKHLRFFSRIPQAHHVNNRERYLDSGPAGPFWVGPAI